MKTKSIIKANSHYFVYASTPSGKTFSGIVQLQVDADPNNFFEDLKASIVADLKSKVDDPIIIQSINQVGELIEESPILLPN